MRPHAQSTGSTWLDTDRVSFRPAFAFADAEILCDCMLAPNRSLVLRECVCGAAGIRGPHTPLLPPAWGQNLRALPGADAVVAKITSWANAQQHKTRVPPGPGSGLSPVEPSNYPLEEKKH